MKLFSSFKSLSRLEAAIWVSSIIIITVSFIIGGAGDFLTLIASLIGATALIFVAKGFVIGQILTVVFAVFYAVISFKMKYYGEMITYLLMTSPMAVFAAVEWIRHPFEKSGGEVKIASLTKGKIAFVAIGSVISTVVFYFILRALGTSSLFFSTLSITTSFIPSALTMLRSPYYALGYSANDIVLIILWIIASIKDISYIPMVICFVIFLINDLYGFFNWRRMKKKQAKK